MTQCPPAMKLPVRHGAVLTNLSSSITIHPRTGTYVITIRVFAGTERETNAGRKAAHRQHQVVTGGPGGGWNCLSETRYFPGTAGCIVLTDSTVLTYPASCLKGGENGMKENER